MNNTGRSDFLYMLEHTPSTVRDRFLEIMIFVYCNLIDRNFVYTCIVDLHLSFCWIALYPFNTYYMYSAEPMVHQYECTFISIVMCNIR